MRTSGRHSSRLFLLIALGCCVGGANALSRDLFRLESTYFGSGTFVYELIFPDDRYWDEITACSLGFAAAVDFLDSSALPTNWISYSAGWRLEDSAVLMTPSQSVFQAQSSQSSFRRAAATVTFTPHWRDWARPADEGDHGSLYANVQCLVPAETADGSPTNVVDRIPGFPELQVEGLVFTNGVPVGVRFSAGSSLPIQIQVSTDLQAWKTIGNTVGGPGLTTWTSSVPVDSEKRLFYRVIVSSSPN